jgi:hypothetical protein
VAGVDEHRREVVRLDVAVERFERDRHHLLGREPEPLEDRHRRVGRESLEQHQLHVGEQQPVDAMADEQRAVQPGGVEPEGLRVHEARTVHRVHAQARPREIDEGQAGDDLHGDLAPTLGVAKQRDRPLGDRRVPGDGVADLPVLARRGDELVGDAAVEALEVLRRVVAVVEGRELELVAAELLDRGVARGAHVAVRDVRELGAGLREHEVDARGSEADHDDVPPGHGLVAPAAGVVVLVGSAGSLRVFGACGGTIVIAVLVRFTVPYWGSTQTLRRTSWLSMNVWIGRVCCCARIWMSRSLELARSNGSRLITCQPRSDWTGGET